jgi:RimJ/RimL family protein N-acetyltransferase
MRDGVLRLPEIILEGRDVLLRPLKVEDAASLAGASGESREHYGLTPVPSGVAEAGAYVGHAVRQRELGERYPFVVLHVGRIVGTTSYFDYQPWSWRAGSLLQRVDRPDVCEIGHTWLAASAQRTRCNTEAKYLLLSYAFETWGVHRVSLRTDERNERSRQAIERLGAKLEGVRRADKPGADGRVRDSALYSIVAAEWADIGARLRRILGAPFWVK